MALHSYPTHMLSLFFITGAAREEQEISIAAAKDRGLTASISPPAVDHPVAPLAVEHSESIPMLLEDTHLRFFTNPVQPRSGRVPRLKRNSAILRDPSADVATTRLATASVRRALASSRTTPEEISEATGALADSLKRHAIDTDIACFVSEGLFHAAVKDPGAVLSSGALPGLVSVVHHHNTIPRVLIPAFDTMSILANDTAGAHALLPALPSLVSAIMSSLNGGESSGFSDHGAAACRVIASVSLHAGQEAAAALAEAGAMEALAGVMRAAALVFEGIAGTERRASDSELATAIYAAETVANATVDDNALARFIDEDGVVPLVTILRTQLDDLRRLCAAHVAVDCPDSPWTVLV